jgi:metal transporter CNNM
MVEGALQMKTKAAVDLFVSYRKVFSISMDTVLDENQIFRIYSRGYSRIPVYEGDCKTCIKGILMTRQLILVNKNDNCPVSKLPLHVPQCVAPGTNLVDLVNLFQTGGSAPQRVGHMALVCARPDIGNRALDDGEAVPQEAGLMG